MSCFLLIPDPCYKLRHRLPFLNTGTFSGTSNNDHFETQKKIKDLRDQYGEDWLKHRSGSLMQDILGMEKFDSPEMSSTPYDEDFMKHAADVFAKPVPEKIVAEVEKAAITTENKNVVVTSEIERSDVNSETSANNTFMTASETFYDTGDEADFEGSSENTEDLDHDSDDEGKNIIMQKTK